MAYTSETKHFLGGVGPLESGRVGRIAGRQARTFHLNLGSVKIGAAETATGALDYALRKGESAGKADELEHAAGDPAALLAAAKAIEASAWIRGGERAERVLVKQTFELPADASPEQRRGIAEAVVDDWATRGHVAIAAVHGNGLVQPHIHVLASARPVDAVGQVDRSVRLWTSKAEVRKERARIAELVNEICSPEVEFHGGRLVDTGLVDEEGALIARAAIVTRANEEFVAFAEPDDRPDSDTKIVLWDLKAKVRRYPQRRMPQAAMHRRQEQRFERDVIEQIAEVLAADRAASGAEREAPELRSLSAEVRRQATAAPIELDVPRRAVRVLRQISGVEFDPRRKKFWVPGDHPNAEALSERFGADRRIAALEAERKELADLSAKQQRMIGDVYAELGGELPDLATHEGRAEAWAQLRQARPRPAAAQVAPAPGLERPAGEPGPYAGLDDAALRKEYRSAGGASRRAARDLEDMAEDHPGRAATALRLDQARGARTLIKQEAERRGIQLGRGTTTGRER